MIGLKVLPTVFRYLPAIVAALTIELLYAFVKIDNIVHGTLYNHGLQFSSEWANPYWTTRDILVGSGFLIAGLSLTFQAYLLWRKVPLEGSSNTWHPESRQEGPWSTFKLADGSMIKVKLVMKNVKRQNKYSSDGMPIYTVETEPVVQIVSVPEELRAAAK